MPPILGFHRGHMHHAPHLTFTLLIAHQHAQQLPHVQPIALGSALATIDFNGGGIDYLVGDPLRLQKAMQPEAFTTRFITTHHRCGFRQTKASFGLGDFLEHARLMTRCDSALTRLLTMARGETELPGFFTQFKGHKQDTLGCGIMLSGGHCGHGLSPPWGKGVELWKRSLPTAARFGNQWTSIVSICSGSCTPYGHPAHDYRVALTLSPYHNSLSSWHHYVNSALPYVRRVVHSSANAAMYVLEAVKIRMTNDFPIQGESPYSLSIALQPNPGRASGL